jgi:hypothetical protein
VFGLLLDTLADHGLTVQANHEAPDEGGRSREIVLVTAEAPVHAARSALAAIAALPGVRAAPRRLAVDMLA